MPQFFIDKKLSPGSVFEISGADARHIANSLRLLPGDWIVLSDGHGKSFKASILVSSPKSVKVLLENEVTRPSKIKPTGMALAVIKPERFEWAIEKTVELGCGHITPFVSARSILKYSDQITKRRLDRWEKIAAEAAKQSGLPLLPKVNSVKTFSELFSRSLQFGQRVLLYEGEREKDVSSFLKNKIRQNDRPDILIIGPEGGFTEAEIDEAHANGAITLSLGHQILRVETAAVATFAIWQYESGNMSL